MSFDQAPDRANSKASALHWLYGKFEVVILSLFLLLAAVAQRLGFKVAGYGLGSTPFVMILLAVAGSVPLNTFLYLYMVKRTGGVLPEYRTLRYFRDYWVIASFNVCNGLAIMWANPKVSGHMQCLISNVAIPMTMLLSALCFRTKFSPAAITGVVLIIMGLMAVSSSPSDGSKSSLMWTGVYVLGQLPLSASCIYQEAAFRESLNMVHYIHYVTLFLLGDLMLAVPLDASLGDATSLRDFAGNVADAWQCIAGVEAPPECSGVGIALACYILSMNAGNLFQALLIKRVDATWYMVVLSLSTPLAAISFSFPAVVGKVHAESLGWGALVATVLVGLGTIIYRLGSLNAQTADDDEPQALGYEPLDCEPASPTMRHKHVAVQTDVSVSPELQTLTTLLEAFIKCEKDKRPKPKVVAAGVGLFASEYTNDTKNPMSLFDEKTFLEQKRRTSEDSPERTGGWRRCRSESPAPSLNRDRPSLQGFSSAGAFRNEVPA